MQDVENMDLFRMKLPMGPAPSLELRQVSQFRSFGSRRMEDLSLDRVERRTMD
jgi:hypothetical protein